MGSLDEKVVAMIMVGGPTKGTKFWPLSLNIPKPLLDHLYYVIHPLKVSLKDLYNGTSKKLSFALNKICSKCKGKGSKSGASMKCPGCQGFGMKVSIRHFGPSMIQQMLHPCTARSRNRRTLPSPTSSLSPDLALTQHGSLLTSSAMSPLTMTSRCRISSSSAAPTRMAVRFSSHLQLGCCHLACLSLAALIRPPTWMTFVDHPQKSYGYV
ncbi:hypothetical protein ACFX2K_040056 [Malus domestica]